MNQTPLVDRLPDLLGDALLSVSAALGEVTAVVAADKIKDACVKLRDDGFETLIDLCGVDYSAWGVMDGLAADGTVATADDATVATANDGAVATDAGDTTDDDTGDGDTGNGDGDRPRGFAVVYHLLSLKNNQRLRLRVTLADSPPAVASVVSVWPAADWYEREAFDLFGILFHGHPDLRRLLTDYGFIGHPMRKDFPLSGQVEMRYDADAGRVIYQPVTIEPRILVPRTIGKPVGDGDEAPTPTPIPSA